MPDYGHDLRFGINLVPVANPVHNIVALAQIADQAGLDYVTFQDHPYNNTFVDAFSLMTWVAAQTEQIRVAGNVLNLPLRPPAMLARSSAALQILSNGRYELGLGAGAFWDPIAAMGGPRRTPGEATRALEEAIDLIRQIWNTELRGGVRFSGEFYQVSGMTRGPEIRAEIPIWLGAYKPKMLKLLGQKGDGWLPSMGYMEVEGFADGNARIDDAAVNAGRRPEDIRRMFNIMGSFLRADRGWLKGTPQMWAEQLAELSLRDGVSTYLLGTQDPADIQTFAEEVAPAVREIVAKARGEELPIDHRRPSLTSYTRETNASRSDKINYDAIPESLRSASVAPDQPGYDRVRSTYMQSGTPGLVLMASSAEQVAEGLEYVQKQDVSFSLRAGGHGSGGLSTNDGGIILDVSRINDISVIDEETRRIRVGTGATWGMVAEALAPHGWAMTSGDFPDVGVGGIVTTGGIGLLARKYGLTIDNMVAAEIVLADGSFHRVSETENPELFWGIRGAGGNLGVVTHVELTALPVENVIVGQFVFDASDLTEFLVNWGAYMKAAPRELQAFAYYSPRRRGSDATMQTLMVWSNDNADAAVAALNPILDIAPVLQQGATIVPYSAIMQPVNQAHSGQQTLRARSGLLDELNRETAEAIKALMEAGRVPWANFRHVGGAVNDVPADATAYAHRTQDVCFTAFDLYPDRRNIDPAWQKFAPFVHGDYLNLETDTSERTVREIYPTPTYERIQRLKSQYDPKNVFNRNFNIPPVK
ncbi:MAG: LLM class flavin-dependent oxidoreductase [Thermomicrobiales bacterium]|nr:LLM class flavin-dependent oxidoreductase [Thermomicrobiales bacterium]